MSDEQTTGVTPGQPTDTAPGGDDTTTVVESTDNAGQSEGSADTAAASDSPESPAAEAPAEAAPAAEAETPAEAPTAKAAVEAAPAEAGETAADAGETTAEATPAAETRPTPKPRPGKGRPGRPGAPRRPDRAAAVVVPTVEPVVQPTDPTQWGRIDEAGVVYVRTAVGEREVGNWQAGDDAAGLAHFAHRFDDFVTEVALVETRLASGSGDPKQIKARAVELRESVETLAAIGDFDSAASRLEVVIAAADAAIAGAGQARAAARARAVAAKEALCAEAEQLAESTAWKATGDRLKAIVDEWKTIHGIDRKTDDALWKRFAKARDTFTRRRGSHFADLDKQRSAAREAKEALIARAQELSESTEWGRTAGEYRSLMEEWKAAGRAPREVEDELWNRFRAAQEVFFSRRSKEFDARDAEFTANAAVKEQLLVEAEAIDPDKGLDQARAALRSIQERWEEAGKVPRERIREFDQRLRAVEDRVRKAEDSHWRRTDPETAARVEQFRARVEQFEAQAAKARAAGDERRAKQAEQQAAQWQEWLKAAESAVES